jgi:hypothetical protein
MEPGKGNQLNLLAVGVVAAKVTMVALLKIVHLFQIWPFAIYCKIFQP